MWYNANAFTASEDRATLGSDPSAGAAFAKGDNPDRKKVGRPLENQSDKPVLPVTFLESPVVHFIVSYSDVVDWYLEGMAAGFSLQWL